MAPLSQNIGSSFIELQQVDSTNNYATALVHEGLAQHGMAVLAHEQTKGKGQRDKTWISGRGENLTFSIIVQPILSMSEAFYLSMATALAVRTVCSRNVKTSASIKWPNDIFINDRKAGGILIENMISGTKWKWAIIGIGLNINQVGFGSLRATSLKEIAGQDFDPMQIAREICSELDAFFQPAFQKELVFDQYQEALYRKDQVVKLRQGSRSFEGIIKGVNTNGQLVVNHGIDEYFNVGEVEWVLEG